MIFVRDSQVSLTWLKAFDRVNYSSVLRWFGCFLRGRTQWHRINNFNSHEILVHSGAPQGSHCSLLLLTPLVKCLISVSCTKKCKLCGIENTTPSITKGILTIVWRIIRSIDLLKVNIDKFRFRPVIFGELFLQISDAAATLVFRFTALSTAPQTAQWDQGAVVLGTGPMGSEISYFQWRNLILLMGPWSLKKSLPETWWKTGNSILHRMGDNAYRRTYGIGCSFLR